GTSGARFRPEMDSENPADHVFVDLDAEGQSDLFGNPLAAPSAVAPFHFNDRLDQFFRWSFGTWSSNSFGREEQAVLLLGQHLVKMQQSGRPQHDGGSQNPVMDASAKCTNRQ